jgi:hypothetical protein
MEMKAKTTEPAAIPETALWPAWLKACASLFIMFHVLAVFWPPFRMATMGGSPFVNYPNYIFEPYYQPLFLDHGYAFFAPEPGPTHVVDFRVFDQSGEVIAEGRFPNLQRHWPRLRYHRYFMLSEQLNQSYVSPAPPPDDAPEDVKRLYPVARSRYLTLKTAIEEGLAREYGGSHAVVQRVEHRSPTYEEFRNKWPLTDPRLFEPLPEFAAKEEPLP